MGPGVWRSLFLIALMGACTSLAESSQDSNDSGRPEQSVPFQIEGPAIFDISAVVNAAPESLLGVEVVAANVQVREIGDDGFWVTPIGSEEGVFTVPAEGTLITVRTGELISVHGEVRLMRSPLNRSVFPRRIHHWLVPYVYAYTVRPAWPKETVPRAPLTSRPVPH